MPSRTTSGTFHLVPCFVLLFHDSRVSLEEPLTQLYTERVAAPSTALTSEGHTDAALLHTPNEGRGRTPGNPCRQAAYRYRHRPDAQRRPGAYPRQSRAASTSLPRDELPLNEGRGRTPGNPGQDAHSSGPEEGRSTKAGGVPPAIPRLAGEPGREVLGRSTKAGGVPPAIPADALPDRFGVQFAQRRPGAYPRQSPDRVPRAAHRARRRSTKAGGVPQGHHKVVGSGP